MADEREHQFQKDIINEMTAQGWQTGKADGYDRELALYTQDLVDFFKEAYPDRWQKFAKAYPGNPERQLCVAVDRERRKKGTLFVLRNPVRLPGHYIDTCAFQPDHGMNPEAEQRFTANRLRVVPEVSYSPYAKEGTYNPRLDLVLFVNGIPTATLELKSEFKQSVERAKRQYQFDRPLKAPTSRQYEPLLAFKTGALVHFAVSQDEVAMTTKLAGKDTRFLPFNKGTLEGGAGNPSPANPDDYATGYLWNEVFAPSAWLRILQRFLHLEQEEEPDFHGNIRKKETMIFPRYHQWDAVTRLIDTTRNEGAGERYLIQHSAGSGKSNSIAWAAHQLAGLYDEQDNKLFNSVIVITDRTVLDSQLQNTIRQFERTEGMVCPITRDEKTTQSKSEQLAEALARGTRIIVVTIQTFPALYDALEANQSLAQGRYAVVADEAHSSQTGSSATKLKAILGHEADDETEEVSAEAMLDAAVASRQPPTKLSYYAFTATPKAKTLELFGRPPNPDEPASVDNRPEPFHLYSMRQAIEEGFILDVLRNYTTYSVAWRLAHPYGDDEEVESRKASATLARWVRLHPYNIRQKVEVIVEHFRANVRHLLDGQAKAMVVTASRQEAVRYMLAMSEYVKEHRYDNVFPLVAFSGEVAADDVIPESVTETSALLNPGLHGRDHAEAFDTGDYNVMLVANKFQTGFDQPKLCAMYVDKKLKGVECVQTLSRLNRIFPGKDTFILDFVNDIEDIREAFEPFYQQTELADVSDAQVVYDLFDKLNDSGIYTWDEVTAYANAFFDPDARQARLNHACRPAKDRFRARYEDAQTRMDRAKAEAKQAEENGDEHGLKRAEHELKEAGEARDALDTFRKDLQSYVRAYEFLSQIIFYDDADLERLCVYARGLHPLLRMERLDDDIDVSDLSLTHYRLNKQAEHQVALGEDGEEYTVQPVSGLGSGKPHDPEKKRLSEIIDSLNEIFGSEINDDDQLHYAYGLAGRIERDESVMSQVRHNDPNQIMHGSFPERLRDFILDDMEEHASMAERAMATTEAEDKLAHLVLRLLLAKHSAPSSVYPGAGEA
ncbi:type I restriction enzyme R subunit [Tamilnaduibacter salinus]|uniref:Restriction endonuclease subunit R n=1 Tax=Tamilnaduibacter salinus TaxID=1484056 RepID=A0A2A2I719_9GAMM|nr:DEAD/DEAH box helicase family protein [Tamilnaduibacter salinus]PAV27539.1 restriction endonuclease subunit R [Tamilnaduibacter salinus]PVY77018.1 type I restriction enzyme R subunit [Tamilnaduibacter salinus]